MKLVSKMLRLAMCFTIILFMAGFVNAEEEMQIPKAAKAPEIDGVLDTVWNTAREMVMGVYVDGILPEYGYFDHYSTFRTMWDDDYFYCFGRVIDDTIKVHATNSYESDCFEVYFDGNNGKTDKYDTDDRQWRWVYGETEIKAGWADKGTWAWLDTDAGYDFELRIPADDMPFTVGADAVIGFEVQVAENDNGPRQTMSKWWSDSNNSWVSSSLFGTAKLVEIPLTPPHIVRETGAPGGKVAVSPEPKVANDFRLSQNYPNPFNPSTTINYTIRERSTVKLTVYNILGNEVAALVNEVKSPGSYSVSLDGSKLPSGLYFYKLEAGASVATKKMMLLK